MYDPVLSNDWHVVAWAKDLGEGQVMRARLMGEELVLWRKNGQVMAWQDLCMHRGSRLSLGWVKDDCLVCPYHGWTYNTDGRCVKMPAHPEQTPPAKAVVKTYQACEGYGAIWVSLGSPHKGLPPFPEWDDDSYRKVACGPYSVNASGPRVIENFLDVAHFPFVHEGYLGDQQHTEIADYEVVTDEQGITAEDIRVWQPDPDGTGVGKDVSYTYKVFRPLTAYFTKIASDRFAIILWVTPVEPLKSIAWMWVTMNYGHEMPDAEVSGFQDKIFSQDLPIVEGQRPELLPLDLQAELHLRSDRAAIAYRKWLGELGLTFGTS
jgi:phenylpropionate dioxygenase-like ring-hydroxylating dioxygenase large terminal subunit